jgi:hypothetical protein
MPRHMHTILPARQEKEKRKKYYPNDRIKFEGLKKIERIKF